MKPFISAVLMMILAVALGGAQDYSGLDEVTLIAGIAVDISDENPEEYLITLEVITPAGSSDSHSMHSSLLSATGTTVFDALYRANEQMKSYTYFGNVTVIIISEPLAVRDGIGDIVDGVLRDFYFRDNVHLIISKEESAKALFDAKQEESVALSFTIDDMLNRPFEATTSITGHPLHKIYNTLSEKSYDVAIPAFKLDMGNDIAFYNEESSILWADGLATFREDKMVGYFPGEMLMSFLFLKEQVTGGPYVFSVEDSEAFRDAAAKDPDKKPSDYKITLQVENSKYNLDYSFDGKQFTFYADVDVTGTAIEISTKFGSLGKDNIACAEECVAEKLESEIREAIEYMQKGDRLDIFGFSEIVYEKDFHFFEKVRDDWEEYFSNAKLVINCNFQINDTGMTFAYGSSDRMSRTENSNTGSDER